DAAPLNAPPGTIAVIEPDVESEEGQPDGHAMDPVAVLRLAGSLGEDLPPVFLVACQPQVIADPDAGDELLGQLSTPVAEAVDVAMALIHELVNQISETKPKGGMD